jgi:hypothetical protein
MDRADTVIVCSLPLTKNALHSPTSIKITTSLPRPHSASLCTVESSIVTTDGECRVSQCQKNSAASLAVLDSQKVTQETTAYPRTSITGTRIGVIRGGWTWSK